MRKEHLWREKNSPNRGTLVGTYAEEKSLFQSPPLSEECRQKTFLLLGSLTRPGVVLGELQLEGVGRGLPCEVYYWPGPGSYTGGPAAEIHTLGCRPLLEAAVRTLCQAGARLAEPGEFTLRAFLNGRMDLTQAEAVLGVVEARDGQQLAAALEQLAGGLAQPLQELRSRLIELLVHLEAGLDFPEEDLPFLTRQDLDRRLQETSGQLRQMAEQLQTRRIASEGITVVLVGRPNAGKSSLFNALLQQSQAIVSPWPGTTRDYLVGQLDLGGIRCRLVDTAGLDWVRVCSDKGSLEAAVQEITIRQLEQADVHLWCVDASEPMDQEEWVFLAGRGEMCRGIVLTKGDLPIRIELNQLAALANREPILTSSRTGQGLEELRTRLRETIEGLATTGGHAVWNTAIRSAESIRLAEQAVHRAIELTGENGPEELIAAEIRLALDEIGKVSGAVYTEDLLERIFSRFCIGK